MAFLVIVFYVLGLLFGLYLGKTLGYDKFYEEVYLKICSHVQGLSDDVESRLQDMDYDSTKEQLLDLGRAEAYQGLMEYMDKEFIIEK